MSATQPAATDSSNLDVALALAGAGVPIFPAKCWFNEKKQKWEKVPRVKGWKELATTDKETLKGWWRNWPNAVPGIELGRAGLVVIDADRHGGPDGVANLAALVAENISLRDHPVTQTAGDGEHHFFKQWPGESFGNSEGALGRKGINVRGKGGWVVAPGARRPDGKRWRPAGLAAAYRGGTIPILPDWIAAKIRQPAERATPAGPVAAKSTSTATNGATDLRSRPTWSQAEDAKVRAALKYIPSDTRDVWLRIGAALHWTGWTQARAIWDTWSQSTPGAFEEEDQAKTWASFDRPFNGNPVTLATLFHLALENGQPVVKDCTAARF